MKSLLSTDFGNGSLNIMFFLGLVKRKNMSVLGCQLAINPWGSVHLLWPMVIFLETKRRSIAWKRFEETVNHFRFFSMSELDALDSYFLTKIKLSSSCTH